MRLYSGPLFLTPLLFGSSRILFLEAIYQHRHRGVLNKSMMRLCSSTVGWTTIPVADTCTITVPAQGHDRLLRHEAPPRLSIGSSLRTSSAFLITLG